MSRNTSKPLKGALCMWRGLRPLDNGYDIILTGKLKQPIELHTHTHTQHKHTYIENTFRMFSLVSYFLDVRGVRKEVTL